MAEAHEAVAFSFKVTEEGVDINFNKDAILALTESCKRSFRRSCARFKNKMRNRIYPIRFSSWPLFTLAICFAIHIGWDFSKYGMRTVETFSLEFLNITTYTRLFAIVLYSLIMWLVGIIAVQYLLYFLFSFNGWLYEPFGVMSWRTKIQMLLIRIFSSKERRLYGYQSSLPKLPVPAVSDTINRVLQSIRHLLTDSEYAEISQLAHKFKVTIANKLQLILKIKSYICSNYVSDWWEKYIYLNTRSPIMINSNFYVLDFVNGPGKCTQTSKAANLIYLAIKHRRNVETETLVPTFVNKHIPLCSAQFERQFNTTRIPGVAEDQLVHYRDSWHVVVLHQGRYYRVPVKCKDGYLRPVDIEQYLLTIVEDKAEASEGEKKLAALTAGERTPWAKARQKYFNSGVNKASIDIIDKAAFFVVLDDEEYHYDPEDPSKLNNYAKAALFGDCTNRWFDKSFTLFVGKNGYAGLNVEHSWADAPVTGVMWEYCTSHNFLASINSDGFVGYTSQNRCVGTPNANLNPPYRLKWEINEACLDVINSSLAVAKKMSEDVDLNLLVHDKFGKGIMKNFKVSPDAFIQIALQLASYRVNRKITGKGSFFQTYEASMTRLFRDGRTETVRSCTSEVCDFVRAFCHEAPVENGDVNCTTSPEFNDSELHMLFMKAVEKHQILYKDAMTGRGIDRHLFTLYVASKYLHWESDFLKKIFEIPWRLSTSQTPHSQLDLLKKHPKVLCLGGGFGPVDDEGYGVSYIIANEDCIFFHVSCKKSCQTTDAVLFTNEINDALGELKDFMIRCIKNKVGK